MNKLLSFFAVGLMLFTFMGAEGSGGCGGGSGVELTAEEEANEEEAAAAQLATGEGETWSDLNVAAMVKAGWLACKDFDFACDSYYSSTGCIKGIGLCAIPCSENSDCDSYETIFGLQLKCETVGLTNLSGASITTCAVDSE